MPSRQIEQTVETPAALMGAGAWVTYIEPSTSEMRDFRAETARYQKAVTEAQARLLDSDGDKALTEEFDALVTKTEEFQFEWLAKYVRDWNWVSDAAGEVPMPAPADNPDAFRDLKASELTWLGSLFNVSIEKKRTTKS